LTAEAFSLVGDIGGTNCRFALARAGVLLRDSIKTCATTGFASPAAAARHYLRALDVAARDGCIAVAGPVGGDRVRLTNQSWRFSIEQTRAELGFRRLCVINDFQAVGLALPHLEAASLQQIGGGAPLAGKPKVALGPGTGYGATHVISAGNASIALPTESGHISIAPSTRQELQLCQWLLDHQRSITCEQLLSGPGLVTLYCALAELRGRRAEQLSAADIQTRAVAGGDALCSAALNLFCELLGTAVRDQVLCAFAQGGAYIAGGIVQRFLPFFRASRFRRRFEDSGAMRKILEAIPVYVITEEYPGLVGAAACCRGTAAPGC
jgi:glucokinase